MDAAAPRCQFARMIRHFDTVPDPRIDRTKRYRLTDILALTLLAVVSGAEGPTDIANYARAKWGWLCGFLRFDPAHIPSHDTLGRVLSLIRPEALEKALVKITEELTDTAAAMAGMQGQKPRIPLHLDGKRLRRSFDRAHNHSAVHLINAYASEAGVVLGQISCELGGATDPEDTVKTNEIPALRELLAMMTLEDTVVTIDAMGCQRDLAELVCERGGDYILAVKANQKSLHEELKLLIGDAKERGFEGMGYDFDETVEKGHGRIETRRVWVTREVDWLKQKDAVGGGWAGLRSVVYVESQREVLDPAGGEPKKGKVEKRYYISSLDHRDRGQDAAWFGKIIRGHWGVENKVHHVLDVAFRQDEHRMRSRRLAENFARLERMVLNLIRVNTRKVKGSVKGKRKQATWSDDFALEVIGLGRGN